VFTRHDGVLYRHPPWLDGCHSTHRGMSDRCHTRLLLPKAYIVDQLRPAYLLSLHEDSLRTYLTASYVLSMCLSCQPRLSSYTPQLVNDVRFGKQEGSRGSTGSCLLGGPLPTCVRYPTN